MSETDWVKWPREVLARGHVLNDEEVRLMTDEIEAQRTRIDRQATALTASQETIDAQQERIAELEGALTEAEEVLALSETPAFPDPAWHCEVKALGQRIGFGALMSTAEAGWRETLESQGYAGGEHTSGPSRSTITNTLAVIRAALAKNDTDNS